MTPTLLVVAKAPVPGLAKTRIGRERGHDQAADIAAASLLDTLDTAVATGLPVVVSMTGDLGQASRSADIQQALASTRVVEQRGDDFAERLVNAHLDADAGHGVVQVGMDSPQVTSDDFRQAADAVASGATVLGPADDGGWWLLGVTAGEDAQVLRDVPMSQPDTGARTVEALRAVARDGEVAMLRSLQDIDTWADVVAVAAQLPGSRLAAAVEVLA